MSTNELMTREQLDAIKTRAGKATTLQLAVPGDTNRIALYHSDDVDTLIAEVERLRALTTVDDAMVERAARAYFECDEPNEPVAYRLSWDHLMMESSSLADPYRHLARVVINAALNPGEGS